MRFSSDLLWSYKILFSDCSLWDGEGVQDESTNVAPQTLAHVTVDPQFQLALSYAYFVDKFKVIFKDLQTGKSMKNP